MISRDNDDSFEGEIESALNEMNILKGLKHKNIVKYIDHSDGKDREKVIALVPGLYLESKMPAYLAMEYCEVSKTNVFRINFYNLY